MDQRRDVANDLDLTTDPTVIPGEPLVDPLTEPDLSALGAAPPEASTPSGGGDSASRASQVTDAATSAAGDAASTAGDEAKRVTAEAKAQARSVVDEVKGQATGLLDQTRDELRAQADARSANAAGALHTLSEQLQALSDGRPGEAGPLAGYLDEARGQVSGVASRLESDGIGGVMSDVTDFARRRPGLFLLAAAGTGFVVGRLVRSGARAASGDGPSADQPIGELAPADPLIAAPPTTTDSLASGAPSTTAVVVP
ncbi:MAG: hypothetical protein ACR2HP_01345 [Ilumatobacteraceae bacterium]